MKKVEEKLGRKLKKPVCAYSLFVKENRQTTQQQNPYMGHVEVMQIVSSMWRSLDAEHRNIYTKQAEIDKVRYQNDRMLFSKEFETTGEWEQTKEASKWLPPHPATPKATEDKAPSLNDADLSKSISLDDDSPSQFSLKGKLLGQKRAQHDTHEETSGQGKR